VIGGDGASDQIFVSQIGWGNMSRMSFKQLPVTQFIPKARASFSIIMQ
jgi:hypothetical protein